MMLGHPSLYGESHLGDLVPQTAAAQVGQLSAVFFTLKHLIEDRSPRYAQPISGYSSDLDVGIFQNLWHAIGNGSVVLT